MQSVPRVEIGNLNLRKTERGRNIEALLIAVDEELDLDGAGVMILYSAVERTLGGVYDKLETQRKRISYLESKAPPKKKTGNRPKQT